MSQSIRGFNSLVRTDCVPGTNERLAIKHVSILMCAQVASCYTVPHDNELLFQFSCAHRLRPEPRAVLVR